MGALSPRNRVAFTTCRRIRKHIKLGRLKHPVTITGRDDRIMDLLADKADTTARAALIVSTRGYVEDGLILARSLASLAIDLNYLCKKDADRFETFVANGRQARRKMIQQCGLTEPDEPNTDWADIKKRAKRWKQSGAIKQRAEKGECLRLYEYAYRHASSFEHSDAWSLLTFSKRFQNLREVIFHLAMLVVSFSLVFTHQAWCRYFGVSDKVTENAVKKHFHTAFPNAG